MSTVRMLILILFGSAIVASASFGAWSLWPRDNGVAVKSESPAPIASAAQPILKPIASTPTMTKPAVLPNPAPSPPIAIAYEEVRSKVLPTGKKHLSQDELLTRMALRLHSDAYNHFIHQKGLGMSRMVPTITLVKRDWKMPEWTSEEITKEQPPQKGAKDLSMIHRLGLKQFASNETSEQPETAKELAWEIHSLDLIGLVVHDVPKVYVSKKLPQMKDLKTTPIRDMDVFESEGLEELVNGKDLYVRSKEGTVRVLGPIRASKTCLKCHADTNDGDMLGAFSYTLRNAEYQIGFKGHGIQGNPLPPDVLIQQLQRELKK